MSFLSKLIRAAGLVAAPFTGPAAPFVLAGSQGGSAALDIAEARKKLQALGGFGIEPVGIQRELLFAGTGDGGNGFASQPRPYSPPGEIELNEDDVDLYGGRLLVPRRKRRYATLLTGRYRL